MIAKLKEWLRRRNFRICPYCGFGGIEKDHIYCMMCGRHLKNGRKAGKE